MAHVKQNISVWVIILISVLLAGYTVYTFTRPLTDLRPGVLVQAFDECPSTIAFWIGYSNLDDLVHDSPVIVKGTYVSNGGKNVRFRVDEPLKGGHFWKGDVIDVCYGGSGSAVLFLDGRYKKLWTPTQGPWGVLYQTDKGDFELGISTDTDHSVFVTLDEIKESISKAEQKN